MAQRSYNGRVINTNPEIIGSGSAPTVNSWIGDSSQGWGVVQTSSGALEEALYTSYLNEECIKLRVSGMTRSGGTIGQFGLANIAVYPGPTISPAVLAGIAEQVKPGYQYKITNRYFLEALAATTGSMRYVISATWYDSNGTRLSSVDGTPDTTISTNWETYEATLTAPVRAAYLVVRANFLPNADPTTGGSGTVYVSSFRVLEVLPARNVASNRTVITNRRAVRDMGTALDFDGVNDLVTGVALDHITQGNPMTLSFLMYSDETSDGTIFASRKDTELKNLHIGWRNTSNRIEGAFFTAGAPNIYRGRFATPFLVKRRWYHVVIVYDGTPLNEGTDGCDVYVNAVVSSRTSANFGGAGSTNNLFALGSQTNGGNYFKGLIDEFRFYNRALSATEISSLFYKNLVPRNGLLIEFLFNEVSGSVATDTSGNGNDGTISGATYILNNYSKVRTAV